MQIFIEKDYSAMSKKAAQIFADEIRKNPIWSLALLPEARPWALTKNSFGCTRKKV